MERRGEREIEGVGERSRASGECEREYEGERVRVRPRDGDLEGIEGLLLPLAPLHQTENVRTGMGLRKGKCHQSPEYERCRPKVLFFSRVCVCVDEAHGLIRVPTAIRVIVRTLV